MNECLLCGHEGIDGETDPSDGEWYCRICIETANAGELPLSANGGNADRE